MFRVQPPYAAPPSDEHKETTRSVLRILNPVITLMRVCGVCTGSRVSLENIGCTDYRFRLLHKDGWFHILYCILLNSYFWICSGIFARKATLLVPMSFEWIVAVEIPAVNATASGCCTWASLNYQNGRYQSWMKDFYLYEQRHGVHENIKDMVKKSRIFLAFVMTIGMLVPGIMLAYAFVTPVVEEAVFVVDRAFGWWNYVITAINCFIFHILLAGSIVSSVIGSYPLCSELDVMNTLLKRCVDDNMQHHESASERNEQLRDIIYRHKHISCLVSGYGNCIAYFQFTAFFVSLPLSCSSLYVIMTRTELQSNVSLFVCILVLCSVSCIVLSITGVRVNVKAHTALQYILKIPTDGLSEITMRDVNQFTGLLTGTTIGYNVYGLFTINPPTILKIVGTLVTYVVVVVQFRPTDIRTSLDKLRQDLVTNVSLLLEIMQNTTSNT